MIALVIEHVVSEGPGTLGDFLTDEGWRLEYAKLYEGYQLSSKALDYDLIVSMGGPMNVYEEEKYPFLAVETEFLRNAVNAGACVLGICLGAQMIAKACGSSVVRSPAKEIGWGMVDLTLAGLSDKMFDGVNSPLRVLQWHEDMFNVPKSGILLGSSAACPHQAFKINNAYGFQFHVEVEPTILRTWFDNSPDKDMILKTYHNYAGELKVQSKLIYSNLLAIINS